MEKMGHLKLNVLGWKKYPEFSVHFLSLLVNRLNLSLGVLILEIDDWENLG